MRRVLELSVALICVVAVVGYGTASGAIPKKINYQGLLTDKATGEPLVGTYSLTFELYDSYTGGSQLWVESQSATTDSTGVVSVVLGTVSPIDITFDGPVYLQVTIGTEVLSPRRELVSAPYAFRAMDSDSLGGLHSSSYSLTGHTHDDRYFTETELSTAGTINDTGNPVDWSKLKNVPSGFADGTDDVGGAGDGYSLDAADGSPVDRVYVDNDGKVGIGTTTPDQLLHVYDGSAGSVSAVAGSEVVIEDDGNVRISMLTPNDKSAGIEFGDPQDAGRGSVVYNHTQDKLAFSVAGATRMTLDSDGEVGIGTEGPSDELHIYNNTNGQVGITVENPNTGSSSVERLSFDNEDGSQAYIATYDEGHGTYPGAMVIANNRPSGNIRFHTGGTERLSISNYGATYVKAPGGSPLQCSTSGAGYVELATTNGAPIGFRMTNTNRDWYLINSPGFADRLSFYDATSTAERFVIEGSSGFVGIGTTNPDRDLDVSGQFRAIYSGSSAFSPTGEFYNSHSAGPGLTTTGNGTNTWYATAGAGINSTGTNVGGFFRATNNSTTGGQTALLCQIGTGDYTYVCYRRSTGVQYDIYGTGGVYLAVPTSKGYKALATTHSPEAWIEDYGSGEIKDGVCHVELDPMLLDCVTVSGEHPMKVFVQLTSPITNQYYVKKGSTGFDVIVLGEGAETVGGTFDYRVVATRKTREGTRFAEAISPEEVKLQAVSATQEQMGLE